MDASHGSSVVGLAPILGIDRFKCEVRASTHLMGHGVGTVVAGTWTGNADVQRLQRMPTTVGTDDPPRAMGLGLHRHGGDRTGQGI